MYVFRTRGHHTTLIEMTQKEYVAALEADFKRVTDVPRTTHQRVAASEARKYVDQGGHHETGLYRDIDGHIRYARADPDG